MTVNFNQKFAVGQSSPTALNVLLGVNDNSLIYQEYAKIDAILERNLPVSIITDLSLAVPISNNELWRKIASETPFIAGTVPVYQSVQDGGLITPSVLLELIQEQAENGVKLVTIHPTPTRELLSLCKGRLIPITSRGGSAVAKDMLLQSLEQNVYFANLDRIIKIAKKNEVVLSIGSSFRSGTIHDGMDKVYQLELFKQIEIAEYCSSQGVSVMIETPGHASPQSIFKICDLLKIHCTFPIMPLGPIPTDIALNKDDLAGSIGAVLMGTRGYADVLSVVTSEEHTGGIPTIDTLIEAIEKYAIAKHIIDLYKIGDTSKDDAISRNRSQLRTCTQENIAGCSRCGDLCPLIFEL